MNSTLTAWNDDGTTRATTRRQPQAQVRRTPRSARRLRGVLVGTGVAALLTCGTAWACAPAATAQVPPARATPSYLCAGNSNPQLVVPGGPRRPTRPTRPTRPPGCSVTPEHGPMAARYTAIS